ncbi:MAG: hypothetical protein M0R17_04080 [Candidatus Omnitrophica bacterium]|jgi:serine/threonine protein kinase|nr:hypothetical protein [Candidatus Omnitrophota bacterium]
MDDTILANTKKYGRVKLDKNNYKAGGGEGAVYHINGIAYKIYFDPAKMLPIAKISELKVLSDLKNIIIPDEIIYDNQSKPIGYTMTYLGTCEFLCKLFIKTYKTTNNISPNKIFQLILKMQKDLNEIHNRNIIVGDYNEMNFLVDKKYEIPFHIDVDSWQTPSFKCKAIKETVQDQSVKMGYFDEKTDWYSWAVVTFQILIGVHPYKGVCPGYKAKDFVTRVKQHISVFNQNVSIPATCESFSIIPTKLLDWYKEVFEKGYRGNPPSLDGSAIFVTSVAKVINGNDMFEIYDYFKASDNILNVFNFKEELFILTSNKVINFQDKSERTVNKLIGLCEVLNELPVICVDGGSDIIFYDFDMNEIDRIEYDSYFFANGACYAIKDGTLIQNTFEKYKKIIMSSIEIDTVNPYSNIVKDGFIIQDFVGKMQLIIPYELGACANIRVKELDGYKIIEGKYEKFQAILICNKSGKYYRFIITFKKDMSTYSIRKDDDIDLSEVNFSVLPNGVTINVYSDEKVELFQNISSQVKEITKPPFNSSNKLFNHNGKLIFISGNEIKKSSMKK